MDLFSAADPLRRLRVENAENSIEVTTCSLFPRHRDSPRPAARGSTPAETQVLGSSRSAR
jgi:hypothetical protein